MKGLAEKLLGRLATIWSHRKKGTRVALNSHTSSADTTRSPGSLLFLPHPMRSIFASRLSLPTPLA
jgi:hypothetical protein